MKFLIVLLIAGISLVAQASEISIRVNPHSLVQGKNLTLGDIAAFTGFTNSEVQTLKKVALGNAPAFGEKRNYSNEALTEILRVHLKRIQEKGTKRITLQIPEEVSVEGNGLIINKDVISKSIEKNLLSTCSSCEFKIEDIRVPQIPTFSPDSKWNIRADYYKLRGPFNVPVEVENPVGERATYWITGRVAIWKKVPVSTRMLGSQDRLELQDIKWVLRDVTFLQDTTPDEAEIIGAQVRMSVGPDQIIMKSHLIRKKALNRGDSVNLTTGSSGWSISVKGIAQEGGFIGDTVKILNPDTKKIISGTVVASGTVEVR